MAAILAISLAAGSADARRRVPPPSPVKVDPDFWREVIEPHGEEVKRLAQKARAAMKTVDDAMQSDAEWAVDQRMRYFRDAFSLLRYARKLSPENTEVLALLGRAADELGETRVAIDALETAVRVLGPDKVTPEIAGRLGSIQLRIGDHDKAIRTLRLAQVGGIARADTAQPLVHLANALAARGEVATAVDVLSNALPATPPGYMTNEVTLVMFALAVLYDRDEQSSAAFEVLDRMKSALSTSFATQLQTALATLRYAPADDQHYYLGLLYEILGQFVEARAQFAIYAASGDSPWRGRALQHVHAIDADRRSPRRTAPTVTTPVRTLHPRRHHP